MALPALSHVDPPRGPLRRLWALARGRWWGMSDADRDPHRRESPAGHILKTESAEATVQATRKQKTAEGTPGQGIPRHHNNRVQLYTTQSHKSIRRLPGSARLDSREQIYAACDAWRGQTHE